jgi:hypothetical protein
MTLNAWSRYPFSELVTVSIFYATNSDLWVDVSIVYLRLETYLTVLLLIKEESQCLILLSLNYVYDQNQRRKSSWILMLWTNAAPLILLSQHQDRYLYNLNDYHWMHKMNWVWSVKIILPIEKVLTQEKFSVQLWLSFPWWNTTSNHCRSNMSNVKSI